MLQIVREFLDDESGATVIEYALIIGIVSVVTIASLSSLGLSDRAMYSYIANQYVAALGG